MSPSEERAARRQRAQSDARKRGNERAAKLEAALKKEPPPGHTASVAVSVVSGPESPVEASGKRIEPDTHERQAKAATARIEASEAARRARPGAASKAPAKPASKPPAKAPRASTAPPVKPAPIKLTQQELDHAIDSMEIEYIQCRDFGHAWQSHFARYKPSVREYESQQKCIRCGTIRVRDLDHRGALLGTHYLYVEGYTIKGMGRLLGSDKDHLRLNSIKALIAQSA